MLIILRIVLGICLFLSWFGAYGIAKGTSATNNGLGTAVGFFIYGTFCLMLLLNITEVS